MLSYINEEGYNNLKNSSCNCRWKQLFWGERAFFNWQNRNTIIRLITTKMVPLWNRSLPLPCSAFHCSSFLNFASYLILLDTLHKTMVLRHNWLKHLLLLYVCDYWFASLLWCVYCTKLKRTASRFMEVDNIFFTLWHCCWCDVSYSFLVYFTYIM